MSLTAEERAEDVRRRLHAVSPAAASPAATKLIADAIRDAEIAKVEEAAALADPPLIHRKGGFGLWRIRRIEIAERIRALKPKPRNEKGPAPRKRNRAKQICADNHSPVPP